MMNTPESAGESSCKRQENGDSSNGSDRPHKKARFAWQVKGKYHLKNDNPESSGAASTNDNETAPSSQNDADADLGNTEQNLEILGDYLLKQDFNTLDSVITDPDKSLLQPSTSTEKLAYPKYVSSVERPLSSRREQKSKVAVSMVEIQDYKEDQCIARWQAKQMAKGFVDNTINRVLDSWMGAPLAHRENSHRIFVFDVAEFVDNMPEDNTSDIENEGILMAISAHGLQNNSSSSSNADSHNEEMFARNVTDDIFLSHSSSPFQSDDDTKCERSDNNKEDDSYDYMAWHETETNDPNAPFTAIRDTSSPTPYIEHQNSSIEFDDGNASGNDILTNHFDFMDTAVSFAIQNKGLTSFGTDYG